MTLKSSLLTAILASFSFAVYSQTNLQDSHFESKNPDNSRFGKAILSSNTPEFKFQAYSEKIIHENDTIPTSEGIVVEDGYIEKMDNYLAFRLSMVNENERFSLDAGPTVLKLYPNGSSVFRLNLNYRFLSLGFNFIPQILSNNDDDFIKGKTTGFGFSTALNFSHWVQEFRYTKTTGYYLENTSDYQSDWNEGDPYIQFPDLHYRSFQGITGYNFNQHFSTKALLFGTERQLKSAGTFLPTLQYRYYIIDNRVEPTNASPTQESKNFEILANVGYYYTHVINQSFYASAGASTGYGLVSSKIITNYPGDRLETKQNNGVFKWDARGAIGYNAERIFSGMLITAENRRFRQQNTNAINTNWRVYLQFHVGYRITAPKKLKENLDAVPFLN